MINYDFLRALSLASHCRKGAQVGKVRQPFTESDMKYLEVANVRRQAGAKIPEWMLKLKKQNRSERKYMVYAPKRSCYTTSGFDKKKRNNKRSKHS